MSPECWEVDVRSSVASGPASAAGNTCFPYRPAFFNLGRVAVVASVGFTGAAVPTKAAAWGLWPDYYEPYLPPRPVYVRKPLNSRLPKHPDAAKDARKPHGPLIVAISIEKQVLKVYDADGFLAESPVSTGMKGHSTPMGVFSVIQKHKFHQSNIYSGAPMPYMQRITWSGIAMHAGVLPGYPASHGCIRMPMAFAVKMWNWTKMGARVLVTPGQMAPQSFSHPLLASVRVPPQPAVSLDSPTTVGDKADKGAPETKITEGKPAETKTASAEDMLELRSSVGHTVVSVVTTGNALARNEAAPADRAEAATTAQSDTAKPQSDEAAKPAEPANAEAAEAPKTTTDGNKPAEKLEPTKTEAAKTDPAKPERAKTEAAGWVKKPDVTATTPAASPDSNKDETRIADPAPAAKADRPKRAGQIAVFISRKDSKLYVRQNFAPLFEVPV